MSLGAVGCLFLCQDPEIEETTSCGHTTAMSRKSFNVEIIPAGQFAGILRCHPWFFVKMIVGVGVNIKPQQKHKQEKCFLDMDRC